MSDYTKLPRDIADCLARGGAPMTDDQVIMLVGYLAPVQEQLTTAQAENEALREGMRKVNATAERHEREMYLAKDEAEALRARVEELERGNAHQRERRNAARDCIQKMKAESLRKQADAAEEAIVCALRTVGNVDPFEVNIHKFANDYAQRLRQQADEIEKAGGEK